MILTCFLMLYDLLNYYQKKTYEENPINISCYVQDIKTILKKIIVSLLMILENYR